MLEEMVTPVVKLLLGGSGALALMFTAYQQALRRRAHVLELYRQAFAGLDAEKVRNARHFVYRMDRNAFRAEHWLDLDSHRSSPMYAIWAEHQAKAELVARAFDQLGLLVREGLMPLNVVARFYGSPALRCWHRLSLYINAVRSSDGRDQPGHLWEWENLVLRIIIPRMRIGRGTWTGLSAHDRLEHLMQDIEEEHGPMTRDRDYKPPMRPWELGRRYEVWKW